MDATKVKLQTILRDNKKDDEQKQTKKRVSFKCFVEFYTYPEYWNDELPETCPLPKDTLNEEMTDGGAKQDVEEDIVNS